jgi:hypothetical protein
MANENITVYHENIRTAYWDTLNRTLHCPIFEEMSPELYDLLMGHEVGHCLYTPSEGWHKAFDSIADESQNKFHFFLNVCEDVRIERLIKEKFPGLKRSFIRGYQELHERNFFGVKGLKSFDKLRLIDRINLNYKFGAQLRIPFEDSEKPYLDRLDSATTFSEIENIAKELYEISKKEKDSIKNQEDLKNQINKDQSGSNTQSSNETGEDDLGTNESGETTDTSNENESKSPKKSSGKPTKSENDEPTSVTDEAFRENEKRLNNNTGNKVANLTLPKADLKTIVIPLDTIVQNYENEMVGYNKLYQANAEACLRFFRQKNADYIRLLIQEFQMQKNATQYRREESRRSGELDTRRLSQYRISNDIFKRMTEVPKGKNHGMLKVIDMSISMTGTSIYNAIEQTLILAIFCDSVQIPYEVYGFSDSQKTSPIGFSTDKRDLALNFVRLRTLLDSRAPTILRRKAMAMLAHFAVSHYLMRNDTTELAKMMKQDISGAIEISTRTLVLFETPLVETIIAMREVVERFKSTTQVDIVNVVYLTDGVGTSEFILPFSVQEDVNRQEGNKYFCSWLITDPKTKHQVFVESPENQLQSKMLSFVQQLTGCRHIGFYICGTKSIKSKVVTEEDKIQFEKYGFLGVKNEGYDTYYLISNELMNSTGNSTGTEQNVGLLEAFNLQQNRKKAARVILSQFAKEIGQRF